MKHHQVNTLGRWAMPALMSFALMACGTPTPGSSSSQQSSSASSQVPSSSSSSSQQQSSSSASSYQVPSNNFAENGGAESGTTNWGSQGDGTISRSTEQRHSGNYSIGITGRTTNWNAITFSFGNLTVGNSYELAVWVKLAAGETDTQMMVTMLSDNGEAVYTNVDSVLANANGWTLLTGNYVHAGGTVSYAYIESESDTVSYFVDDFSIAGEVADTPVVVIPPATGGSRAPFNGAPGTGLSAGGQKFVGNIIPSNVQINYGEYWNQVTPENSTKWGAVEGSRDNMNWSQADTAYNYAKTNGLPFKFHVLVWGSQEPSWIAGLSAADQKAEVEEWIRLASERYPDVDMIDVVNEPQHAPASYRNAIGGSGATGWDWIVWSFEKARQYFPNARLHLNDYGIINDGNALRTHMQIAQILKDRGLIDGIAIQCHQFNIDTLAASTIRNNLNTLATLNLPIYIAELDITGSDQQQRDRYAEKFPIFYEHASVDGVTLWGYVVGQTWIDGTGLVNSNGSERPAMQWLKTYFNQ